MGKGEVCPGPLPAQPRLLLSGDGCGFGDGPVQTGWGNESPQYFSQDALTSFITCCGLSCAPQKRYVDVLTPGTCDSDLV